MSTPPEVPGYALTGQLGAGATATVWRARRRADALPVAVKVVAPAEGRVGEALQEAGLLARVRHPHVVHLYDVLPVPAGADGEPAVALVTQLAAGGSLAQVLARRRLLSPGELVTVLAPVAGALADLHELGVVHGDLSTGNIVFREDGMPLLADLGTARIVGEQRLRGIGTGAGDGMVAPEVVEGFPATQESDVYQLGALARLALTGQVPGPGFDRQPLAELGPDLPRPLIDLVDRCMAGAPEDRPDAEELVLALHAVATPEPVEVAPDADAAHGLTQRLRQVAQEDEEARAERGQPGAHRPERVGGSDGSGERGAPDGSGAGAVPRGRVLAAIVVGALVLVMLVGVGWSVGRSWWGDRHDPSAEGSPEPHAAQEGSGSHPLEGSPGSDATGGSSERHTSVATPPASPAPVGQAPQAPQAPRAPQVPGDGAEVEAMRRVLQDLVDARAGAWEATDLGLLDDVVADGSPARREESSELSRAVAAGISYPSVRFEVRELAVTHEEPDRLQVEATVVREPLEARDAQGWLLRTPTRSERVALELVRQEGRWLLWSWSEVG